MPWRSDGPVLLGLARLPPRPDGSYWRKRTTDGLSPGQKLVAKGHHCWPENCRWEVLRCPLGTSSRWVGFGVEWFGRIRRIKICRPRWNVALETSRNDRMFYVREVIVRDLLFITANNSRSLLHVRISFTAIFPIWRSTVKWKLGCPVPTKLYHIVGKDVV